MVSANELCVKLKNGVSDQTLQNYVAKYGGVVDPRDHNSPLKWRVVYFPEPVSIENMFLTFKSNSLFEKVEFNHAGILQEIVPNDPMFNQQWALKNTYYPAADIGFTKAWEITTGNNDVIIAIFDSGIPMNDQDYSLSHPELNDLNKIILGINVTNEIDSLRDRIGHGTKIAGIIGAKTNNNEGIAGVCWNCKMWIIKIFEGAGYTKASYFRRAIEYLVTEKNIIGTNKSIILNASLSFSYNDTISQISQIIDAVELANKEGVLINVAMGNHFGVSKYDFNYLAYLFLYYNNILSIGATDVSGDRASYSNTGYHISVSAPGGGHHQILSTMPDYLNNNDFYGFGIIDAAKAIILTKARPKNLRITNYNNRPKLMWDLIDAAILYNIYRGVDDGYKTEYFLIGRTTSNVNFYVDYSQRIESQTGSSYLMSYRVTANFSNNLESAFSNKANILVSMPTLEKFNFCEFF
ncbi:MAG: S8 family serine peptidase [Ignavibacteria bacterium]